MMELESVISEGNLVIARATTENKQLAKLTFESRDYSFLPYRSLDPECPGEGD